MAKRTIIKVTYPHPNELYGILEEPNTSPLHGAWFYEEAKANFAVFNLERIIGERRQEQCEGFSNKETWAVAFHLDNVSWMQGLYKSHLASATVSQGDYVEEFTKSVRNMVTKWHEDFYSGDTAYFGRAELKHVREMLGDIGSLWRVNWKELAEHLLKD